MFFKCICNIAGAIDYYYGTQLRYAAITINTTINDADIGYIKGLPLRDRWEEVIGGEVSNTVKLPIRLFLLLSKRRLVWNFVRRLSKEVSWDGMVMIPYCTTPFLFIQNRPICFWLNWHHACANGTPWYIWGLYFHLHRFSFFGGGRELWISLFHSMWHYHYFIDPFKTWKFLFIVWKLFSSFPKFPQYYYILTD